MPGMGVLFRRSISLTVTRGACTWLWTALVQEGNGLIDWRKMMLGIGRQKTQVPPEDMFNLAFEIFDKVA